MNSIINFLVKKNVYSQISGSDVIERQRFILYRIFSYTGAFVCTSVFIQMELAISHPGFLPWLILSLGCLMKINFFMTAHASKLKSHYWVMMIAAFILLHTVAYTCGGILTGGSLYWGAVIIYAFFLLGKKSGQYYTAVIMLHFIFMFLIGKYTTWTNFNMFKNDMSLVSQDFLTNGLLTCVLIAALASYLQSGNNVVIKSIEKSRDEAIRQNEKLEHYNELLEAYSFSLENANKDLEKFVSIASHDLKSPLRAVAWLTSMIEEDMEGNLPEVVKSNFNILKQRVGRMELLLNGLLEYTKAEKSESKISEVCINSLLVDFLVIEKEGKKITFEIQNELPKIIAEEYKIKRVFSNLIDNAIRFNDKDEILIKIYAEADIHQTTIYIKDNGPGIDSQFQDKIFVLFQTLNRRDDCETMGVGLSIAKKIIEQRQGEIFVNSEIGKGSTFIFTIPHKMKVNPINRIQEFAA